MKDYKVYYFINEKGDEPVREYIEALSEKEQVKIFSFVNLLKEKGGYLDEPYSRHITGKIRELRIDFSRNHHRILFFTFTGRKIILLSVFLKKTKKTPSKETTRALNYYKYFLKTTNKYD